MRRKRTRVLTGCPRCGEPWAKRAGLIVCSSPRCGYCPDTAVGDRRPKGFLSGQVLPARDPADLEARADRDPPGRLSRELDLKPK